VGLSGLNLRVLVPYLPALGWGALRTVEISALWHRSCRRRYLCCLGLSTWKSSNQRAFTDRDRVAAAGLMFSTSVDLIVTLLAAGFFGITIFNSRRTGIILLSALITMIAGYYVADYFLLQHSALASAPLRFSPGGPRLWEVGVFFFKVGAFTFGGGLSMLAFMQEQVVNQLGWLTPKEFIDGLALGQLVPGPPLMLAAFIGFKLLLAPL
jgi:chromate transporter